MRKVTRRLLAAVFLAALAALPLAAQSVRLCHDDVCIDLAPRAALDSLEARIAFLEAELADLRLELEGAGGRIFDLETAAVDLELRVAELEATLEDPGTPEPDPGPEPLESVRIVSMTDSTAVLELVYVDPAAIGAARGREPAPGEDPSAGNPPVCPPFFTPQNPAPSPARTTCSRQSSAFDVWAIVEDGAGGWRAIGPVTVPARPAPPPSGFAWDALRAVPDAVTFDSSMVADGEAVTIYAVGVLAGVGYACSPDGELVEVFAASTSRPDSVTSKPDSIYIAPAGRTLVEPCDPASWPPITP